jgi:hypothetical protein
VTDDRSRTEGRWNVAEVMIDVTGLGIAGADVPLLDRVLTGLRGDTDAPGEDVISRAPLLPSRASGRRLSGAGKSPFPHPAA